MNTAFRTFVWIFNTVVMAFALVYGVIFAGWLLTFLYMAFVIIVTVAADTRGRFGGGWFLLALFTTPLVAGLLLLALPRHTPVTVKVAA